MPTMVLQLFPKAQYQLFHLVSFHRTEVFKILTYKANVLLTSSRAIYFSSISQFFFNSDREFMGSSAHLHAKHCNDSVLSLQPIRSSEQLSKASLERHDFDLYSTSPTSESHIYARDLHSELWLPDRSGTPESLAGWASSNSKVHDASLENIHEQSDMNYFAFTPKNLHESQHAYWYSNWTLKRQNDPRWVELGEWRLFAIDYFNTRNLDCGSFWIDCKDMPTWSDILALYPDDRELARHVYFTSESYIIIRNYLKAIQTILDEVHISLYGMLPEIIQVFTNQPDPSAQAACAMIGAFIDTLINVGVTAVTGMMTSTITSFYDKMKTNVIAATHDANEASKWYTKILTCKLILNFYILLISTIQRNGSLTR